MKKVTTNAKKSSASCFPPESKMGAFHRKHGIPKAKLFLVRDEHLPDYVKKLGNLDDPRQEEC